MTAATTLYLDRHCARITLSLLIVYLVVLLLSVMSAAHQTLNKLDVPQYINQLLCSALIFVYISSANSVGNWHVKFGIQIGSE